MPAPGATIAYNGLALDTYPYALDTLEGLFGSPEIVSSDLPRVSRSGMVAGTDYYRGRTVTITVNVYADDATTFNTAVANLGRAFAAPLATPLPLSFTIPGISDGLAAILNLRPRKLSAPYAVGTIGGRSAQVAVELYATDPLIYSAAETVAAIGLSTSGVGLQFNLTFNLSFGGATSFGGAVLLNSGSATAPAVIRINGPVTNPTVRNVTTGQSLNLTTTLVAGEFVNLDTSARTVMLNGTADRYSLLTTPQWWGLVPGLNEIRYFADVTVASISIVTYRSAWV